MTTATADVDARGMRRRDKDGHRIAWIASGEWRDSYRGLCTDGRWWEQTTGRALKPTRAPSTGAINLAVTYSTAPPRPLGSPSEGSGEFWHWQVRVSCGLGHTGSNRYDQHGYNWRADVAAIRSDPFSELPVNLDGPPHIDSRSALRTLMKALELRGWRFEDGVVDCPKCVAERARFAKERAAIDRENGAGQIVATTGLAESSASAEPLGAP